MGEFDNRNNLESQAQAQENVGDSLIIQKQIDEIYNILSTFTENDEDKEKFKTYINGLSNKQEFIDLYNKIDPGDLYIFVSQYGLPGKSDENIKSFYELGGIHILTNIEQEAKNEKYESERKVNAKKGFNEVFNNGNLDLSTLDSTTAELINLLVKTDVNNPDFDIIKKELYDNLLIGDNLAKLLDLVAGKSKEDFEKLEAFLVEADEGNDTYNFGQKLAQYKIDNFEKFSTSSSVVDDALRLSRENAIFVQSGSKREGNLLKTDLGDEMEAVTDYSKNPPVRVVTNGNYEIKSEPFLGPLLRPSVEYKKRIGDLQEERKKINGEGEKLMGEGRELFAEVEDIKSQMVEVKGTFGEDSDMYKELSGRLVETEQKLAEIQQKIEQKRQEVKEIDASIEKTKNEYIRVVQDRQENYAEILKEKDEEKKETLKKLHETGFDIFPQETTDKLINDYKSNVFSIPGLNLKKGTLDIANGRFGESVIEEGGDKWIDNLVMFMEKAIYGEVGHNDSVFKGLNFKMGATVDPTKFRAALEKQGIVSGGNWNIKTLRDNLNKKKVEGQD